MFSTPEQLSAIAKTMMDSQLTAFHHLAQNSFAGVEKLIELNVSVAKTSIEDANLTFKQMLEAKDPNAFFGSAQSAQPASDKARAYVQQVSDIASDIRAEFSKAVESHVAETNRTFTALVEEASKNAPAGSDSGFAMLKSVMTKATEGYEQMTLATKQTAASIEDTMSNTVKHFPQVVTKSTPKSSKK